MWVSRSLKKPTRALYKVLQMRPYDTVWWREVKKQRLRLYSMMGYALAPLYVLNVSYWPLMQEIKKDSQFIIRPNRLKTPSQSWPLWNVISDSTELWWCVWILLGCFASLTESKILSLKWKWQYITLFCTGAIWNLNINLPSIPLAYVVMIGHLVYGAKCIENTLRTPLQQ